MKKDNIIVHVIESTAPYKFFMLFIKAKIVPDIIIFKDYIFNVRGFYMVNKHWHIVFDVNTSVGNIRINYCINNEHLTWELFENTFFVTAEGVKIHARA